MRPISGSTATSINKNAAFGLKSNQKRFKSCHYTQRKPRFDAVYGLVESSVHIFFKNYDGRNVTVNGARYRAMILDYLLPEIEARNLDDIWFQQGGATCDTAAQTMDLLRGHFEEQLISRDVLDR